MSEAPDTGRRKGADRRKDPERRKNERRAGAAVSAPKESSTQALVVSGAKAQRRSAAAEERVPAAFAAQLMGQPQSETGQDGQKPAPKPALNSYLQTKHTGQGERRSPRGRFAKRDV